MTDETETKEDRLSMAAVEMLRILRNDESLNRMRDFQRSSRKNRGLEIAKEVAERYSLTHIELITHTTDLMGGIENNRSPMW